MEFKMRDPYSLLWYLKGSIQALDPQSVHVGVGNVIDQLHLDSVISSERSSTRDPAQGTPCLLWALVLYIRITVKCVNEGGNEANNAATDNMLKLLWWRYRIQMSSSRVALLKWKWLEHRQTIERGQICIVIHVVI